MTISKFSLYTFLLMAPSETAADLAQFFGAGPRETQTLLDEMVEAGQLELHGGAYRVTDEVRSGEVPAPEKGEEE